MKPARFIFSLWCACCTMASAQSPLLIFHSGFEPNTDTIGHNANGGEIWGVDNSVAPPNDWIADLDGRSDIGVFSIQYEGGTPSQRIAELVPDPLNGANTVLKFWIDRPNVPSYKSRVQANIYGNDSTMKDVSFNVSMLLPHDIDTLKMLPVNLEWLTLMEFWNNPGWQDPEHGFRITLNLYKPYAQVDSFYFHLHGQTYDSIADKYDDRWETWDSTFFVPTGRWMGLHVHFIEGDSLNGKFFMTAQPDGGALDTIFNFTHFTHHPDDPNPDGLSHFNPMKLYTSGELVDSLSNWGKLLQVHWDDFELYKDTSYITASSKENLYSIKMYPNPADNLINVQIPSIGTISITDIAGRVRYSNQVEAEKLYTIDVGPLPDGIYLLSATFENGSVVTRKVSIN